MKLSAALLLAPLLVEGRVAQGHRRTVTSRLETKSAAYQDEGTHKLGERLFGAPAPVTVNLPSTSVALGTNICLSVQTPTTVSCDGSSVNLKADTCVCIDGTLYLETTYQSVLPQVSLQLDGTITSATQADGQVTLSNSIPATSLARTLIQGAAGLNVGICYQVTAAVNDPFSVHDFSNIHADGCCKRKCTDGYVSCGGTCINKNDYTCVSGVPKSTKGKRDLSCPGSMTKCPVGSTGWECIDINADIESCGGCIHPDRNATALGSDCTALPHVGEVACIHGQCHVKSCQRGFALSADKTTCEVRAGRAGAAANVASFWSGFSVQNRGL